MSCAGDLIACEYPQPPEGAAACPPGLRCGDVVAADALLGLTPCECWCAGDRRAPFLGDRNGDRRQRESQKQHQWQTPGRNPRCAAVPPRLRAVLTCLLIHQCIVVNDNRVALGQLGRRALTRNDEVTVEDAMSNGPRTIRPNVPLADLLERLERQNLRSEIVTMSDGKLVGIVREPDIPGA